MVVGWFFAHNSFSSTTSGGIDATDRYAYSENVGWISFGETLGDVHITDSELTGYAYGENVGWISLNCANDDSCATSNYEVANDGEGNLSGYAWGENTGWINFNPTGGGVVINSVGELSGYAYGENIGWISFNCSDADSCTSSSYKVKTDWRAQTLRPACNNNLDDDGDGLIDYPGDKGCSSLDDESEVDSGAAFIPPAKPRIQNISIKFEGDSLSLKGLPANIVQMAVSTSPDFEGVSWEDIAQKDDILRQYDNTPELYFKFRTNQGATSDVITYERSADVPSSNLKDGDIVKTANNPDVYIIKLKNNKQYKRLILSPSVFKSYGHLKWNNLKIISQAEMDSYVTSSLVKETKDSIIYELFPNGDDGERKLLDAGKSYDGDSVYEINAVDRDSYKLIK